MKILAVVVTYNRLSLLQECIAALQAQTFAPSGILVINNSSTDGTTEWLQAQQGIQTINQPNLGGAWGFYTGIKEAYNTGADWVWVMDDDTIPFDNALEELVKAIKNLTTNDDPFGFLGSKVVWTDGALHQMNWQSDDPNYSGKKPFEFYVQKGIRPVLYNSFVSMLIARAAIEQAGLPIKEFFIWHDDVEYGQRIISKGFKGALVPTSVVLHKTPVNYKNDLLNDSPNNAWKYKYGLRNELYARRHKKGYGSFLRNSFKRFFFLPFTILLKRKKDRWPFIKVVLQSTWDALYFNPPKEKVK